MRQRIAGTAGQPRASPTVRRARSQLTSEGTLHLSRSGPTKSDRRGRPAARARRAGGARRSRRCRSPRSPLRRQARDRRGARPFRRDRLRGTALALSIVGDTPARCTRRFRPPNSSVRRTSACIDARDPRSTDCAFGLGCQAAGILERSLVDVGEEKPVVAEPFDAGPAHAASGARDDGHAQWSSSRSGLTSRSCLGIPLSAGRLDLKTLDLFCKEVVSWPG